MPPRRRLISESKGGEASGYAKGSEGFRSRLADGVEEDRRGWSALLLLLVRLLLVAAALIVVGCCCLSVASSLSSSSARCGCSMRVCPCWPCWPCAVCVCVCVCVCVRVGRGPVEVRWEEAEIFHVLSFEERGSTTIQATAEQQREARRV